ncbi:MAG TPA: hypothetical protein VLC28_02690 [Flavitalea sp.]|nr:hypothetical protein [Flavitalea sp.]
MNPLQKKVAACLFLLVPIMYFESCKFYKPITKEAYNDQSKDSSLSALNAQGRYFILRKGYYSYSLTDLVLDANKMTLTAKPGEIPRQHSVYVLHKENKPYKYSKSKGEAVVLSEAHIYTVDTSQIDTSSVYTVQLSDVKKIEMIEFDKKKTHGSVAGGIVAGVLGAALATVAIAALSEPSTPPPSSTVSSCPYVSTFDGDNYDLQGEIYSASIYQSLQKDDYLPLQVKGINGNYHIKISNELKEVQHTDFADLLVVDHDANVQVLINPDGRMISVSNGLPPESASLNNHVDVRNELLMKDNVNCYFKDDNGVRSAEDLFITFKHDSKQRQGKLILSGKTSSWVNYLFGEFTREFGSYYHKWAKQQEKKPASELEKWRDDQNIPLTVSIKTPTGWKEIQKLKAIGPLLNRDMVIPVDLPNDEIVEFKISCGYLFWELDYVAMDYSPNTDFSVTTIKPFEAIDETGANVLPSILQPDKQYLVQPKIGNATVVKYKSMPAKPGKAQTFFLHSSGYYTHIRNYKGSPKTAFLKSFEKPGALASFSRQKFAEGMQSVATK